MKLFSKAWVKGLGKSWKGRIEENCTSFENKQLTLNYIDFGPCVFETMTGLALGVERSTRQEEPNLHQYSSLYSL